MRRSINAKLADSQVGEALQRRRDTRTVTHLMDHAVPSDLKFEGVLSNMRQEGRLSVHISETTQISPFVLHLKTPARAALELIEEETHYDAPNLLLGANLNLSVRRPVVQKTSKHDLALKTQDIEGQLTEEALVYETRVTPAKHATQDAPTKPKVQIVRARQEQIPVAAAPVAAPLPIRQLAPPAPPKDLVARFELPEAEEDDTAESDIVEFVPASKHTSPVAVRETAERASSWEWPSFAFAWRLPEGWQRALAAFVLMSFACVLPLHAMSFVSGLQDTQAELEASGQAALSDFRLGADAALTRDVALAAGAFDDAAAHFDAARGAIDELGAGTQILLSALPLTQSSYRTGTALVEAGDALAIAGERMAQGFIAMNDELDPRPTTRLELLSTYLGSALPYLQQAQEQLGNVRISDVPEDQQDTLATLQTRLPSLIGALKEFQTFSEMGRQILGADGTKRYLVIFQNNTELRPTGGFMGSFAQIDIRDGEIVRMDIPGGGTYDLQGQLRSFLAAPEPLRLINARWEFQDANWFPDFPTSARQMLDFYTSAGGPTVDGVIAVNATYVANLLDLIGPIDMPEYERTMTSENFVFEAQKIVELEYDKEENAPKAFIGDLAPKLLERAMDGDAEHFLALSQRLSDGLAQRDIQLYFEDSSLERQVQELGWGGEVKWTDGDYLMVVHTNLGGGKTDGVIADAIDLDVRIDEDGSIINTLTVSRDHAGVSGSLFTGVNNVDYLRVYVPKGSELISAEGFSIPDAALFETPQPEWSIDDDLYYAMQSETSHAESGTRIFEESGKTVFGNWIQTRPGMTATAHFTYKLPFTLDALTKTPGFFDRIADFVGFAETEEYTLTVQKQSGVLTRHTNVRIHVPGGLTPIWTSHNLDETISFPGVSDVVIGALFEPTL